MTPTTTTCSNYSAAGREFAAKALALGFTIEVKDHGGEGGCVLTISKSFTPGDAAAYVSVDGDASHLIHSVPVVSYGSTWGTTSEGVGGHAGLTGGYYRLNRSGVSKRFATAAAKAARS